MSGKMTKDKLEAEVKRLQQRLQDTIDEKDKENGEIQVKIWDLVKQIESIYATPWFMPWKMHKIAKEALYGGEETND